MNQPKHYGTIAHWFPDMNRGSIIPDQSGRRIFADSLSLNPSYPHPQSGDRVSFDLADDSSTPTARNILPVQHKYQNHASATIILTEWNLAQNGGFGTDLSNQGQPVFILGQHLADQTRVPEIGDRLTGTLHQHDNGHWFLTHAVISETAPPPPPEPVAAAEPPVRVAEVFYRAPKNEKLAALPPKQVMSGIISHWDDAKGFGFIRFGSASQTLFFHISAFHYHSRRPKIGSRVSFFCKRPIEGERQKAERVVIAGDEAFLFESTTPDHDRLNINTAKLLPYCLTAAVYLAAVAAASRKLAAVYLAACIVSFFLYRSDKRTALRTRGQSGFLNRTPENTLHAVDLAGGWPGALIARAAFSHKTRKQPFVAKFWLTVALNLAITYALLIHYADNPLLAILKN